MIYNDFPILNDNDYKLLNEHFSLQQFNRKNIINQLCNELNVVANICLEIKNSHNNKIKTAIENTQKTVSKLFDNFSSLFNIYPTTSKTILNTNIFSFFKRLTKILELLTNWEQNETKEYYKTLTQKSINEITKELNGLFVSLENSNFYFFKHM